MLTTVNPPAVQSPAYSQGELQWVVVRVLRQAFDWHSTWPTGGFLQQSQLQVTSIPLISLHKHCQGKLQKQTYTKIAMHDQSTKPLVMLPYLLENRFMDPGEKTKSPVNAEML